MMEPKIGSRVIAELLVRLGRIAAGEGLVEGLTPTQWAVLRWFARANRFSRTPSAFAAYHCTTRGTASQTIKNLVAQDYLTQTRSKADGRSIRLDLTDKTRAVLANDPLEALVGAADALSPGVRGHFSNVLQRMLGQVALESGKRPFGTCMSCEHLRGEGCCLERQAPYACGFVGKPLELGELGELCINFGLRKASAIKRPSSGAAI